jgi:hypothetical protein
VTVTGARGELKSPRGRLVGDVVARTRALVFGMLSAMEVVELGPALSAAADGSRRLSSVCGGAAGTRSTSGCRTPTSGDRC